MKRVFETCFEMVGKKVVFILKYYFNQKQHNCLKF